ncbi:MAG: hypothetical protein KGN02_09350 [bacterium]|nr:hypothetical protein [bacterium]
MRTARIAIALFVGAGLAACGGGGGGSSLPASPGGAHGAPAMALRIVIPASSAGAPAAKRAQFVPASTKSIVYTIASVTGANLVEGPNFTNVATSPDCVASPAATTCNINVPAAITSSGSYTVTVAAYDAAQSASCVPEATPACSGTLISLSNLPKQITVGSPVPVSVTLGGIPVYFQPVALTGLSSGNASPSSTNGFTMYGTGKVSGIFELLDAHQEIITDPGAPQASVSVTPAGSLAATVGESGGVYTLTLTPGTTTSAEGPVVQTGTYTVTLSVTQPQIVGSTAMSVPLSVRVAHSAVYAASCSSTCTAVYGFFDGNTTPGMTFATATMRGNSELPLATDLYGNLYVGDATAGTVTEYAPAPDTTPSPVGTISGVIPAALTVDDGAHVYVENCLSCGTSPSYAVQVYDPAAFGSPASTLALPSEAVSISVDQQGGLYTLGSGASSVSYYPQLTSIPSGISLPIAASAIAIGMQSTPGTAGQLWDIGSVSGVGEIDAIASGTFGAQTITTGVGAAATDLALDGAGNIYAANGAATPALTVFDSGGSPTGTLSVPGPTNVTVVPSANQYTANKSSQTPIPIASAIPTP